MKIYSWNINGLRAMLKKPDFADFLKKESPDVLLLQEIKISKEARQKENVDLTEFGYTEYWNSATRPGYSGTLALIKSGEVEPPQIQGLGIEKFDEEGRIQTLEFLNFFLINAYFPNSNHELSRLNYKLEFNRALHKYIKKLDKKKPVIIGGDFNVAHQEIDIARSKDNIGHAGFTKEERAWMTEFLNSDFEDAFRVFYPDKIRYSWWSYRALVREKNIGWRLDYFCVSKRLLPKIKSVQIHNQILGSDHCPVSLEI